MLSFLLTVSGAMTVAIAMSVTRSVTFAVAFPVFATLVDITAHVCMCFLAARDDCYASIQGTAMRDAKASFFANATQLTLCWQSSSSLAGSKPVYGLSSVSVSTDLTARYNKQWLEHACLARQQCRACAYMASKQHPSPKLLQSLQLTILFFMTYTLPVARSKTNGVHLKFT